ncbi:oxidoreductase [Virgisporangium aliadipatigenens]|uniref:Oxidoreductase n=1 Tax=Virgisporangium aliadipatigenens TaxID=741659 RepID=A0A8J3YFX7_9ACTN|nr:oxidoreductase [Virgisporangium aliadipatigenens]
MAGPTLAFWLARHGFSATVVERSQGLRSSGNPVDVHGPAFPVAESMGIVPALQAAATHARSMTVLATDGRPIARIPMQSDRAKEFEVPRGDLANLLYEAARGDAEFLFDETITTLTQDADGVDVTFDRAAPRRFDLVIGADGLHSHVRRLVFGPEPTFVRHRDMFVATLALPGLVTDPDSVVLYNAPGRLIAIHPARGTGGAAFIFRGRPPTDVDHRDPAVQKKIVLDAHAGLGWRVPELLDAVRAADDLYFDVVSEVHLDSWARGRVALLGDAASCVSLFGEGSSLAMAGAHTLAAALAVHPDEPAEAFGRYEAAHRKLVGPRQRRIGLIGGLLVPGTGAGLAARNLAARGVSTLARRRGKGSWNAVERAGTQG